MMSNEWQPIETAPKDKTRIILWRDSIEWAERAEMVVAEWYLGAFRWPSEHDCVSTHGEWSLDHLLRGYESNNFTHWMPLPKPPVTE